MQVRVIALGQSAIGALNLAVAGVARDAKDGIGIGRRWAHRVTSGRAGVRTRRA
jgi:hypothetical protein